jgi:hypothetical protein
MGRLGGIDDVANVAGDIGRGAKLTGRLDIADEAHAFSHLVGNDVRLTGKGISGCHNADNFVQFLRSQGFDPEQCVISRTPHPTIPGIEEIRYQVPKRNPDLSITEPLTYRPIRDPKTVYDPNIISDQQMFDWGKEAMENLVYGDSTHVEGIASNGLRFVGYFDTNGKIKNFYPIISQ